MASKTTSGHSNWTKRPHSSCTGTFNSKSLHGTNVHPIQHMLPWAQPNPHPKRHLNRFSHFTTGHNTVPIHYNGPQLSLKIAPSHQNCPFAWGIWTPPKSISQTASRLLQPFLHGTRSRRTYRPCYSVLHL